MTVRVSFSVMLPEWRTMIYRGISEKKYDSILATLRSQQAEGLIEDYHTEIIIELDAPVAKGPRQQLRKGGEG